VRYLIGQENNGQPVYRICQVNNLAPDFVKPYKINDKMMNQAFELKHGKSMRTFNMDKVSNGPFTDKEYDRLASVYKLEGLKLPTKQALEKKQVHMQKLVSQPMTETDVSVMLARKNELQVHKDVGLSTAGRSMLNQQRTLALRRQDYAEVREIDAKLADDAVKHEPTKNEPVDLLAKVNERNRKANMEAVRKAEMAEAERKRRERKLVAQNGRSSTPVDPSARLKIMPRTFTPTTPGPGTPPPSALADVAAAPVKSGSSFEASLIDSLEIDLGDF
jgi:RNA polymerase-associated protein RTF1